MQQAISTFLSRMMPGPTSTCARAARMHSSARALATVSRAPRMDPDVSTHSRMGPRSAVGRISRRSGTICVSNSLQPSRSYVCRPFSASCGISTAVSITASCEWSPREPHQHTYCSAYKILLLSVCCCCMNIRVWMAAFSFNAMASRRQCMNFKAHITDLK